jgi:hypothetical protein
LGSLSSHSSLNEQHGGYHAECEDGKEHPETQPPIGDRIEQEAHERYAATFTHPASRFRHHISMPRQEHQVGRFLGISLASISLPQQLQIPPARKETKDYEYQTQPSALSEKILVQATSFFSRCQSWRIFRDTPLAASSR